MGPLSFPILGVLSSLGSSSALLTNEVLADQHTCDSTQSNIASILYHRKLAIYVPYNTMLNLSINVGDITVQCRCQNV